MNKKLTCLLVSGLTFLLLSFTLGFGQGDNSPDPMVNLGCLESAVVTGSIPEGEGRGIPTDILWNPATESFLTESQWHEYGMGYDQTMGGITRENPLYLQVEWPTPKNINYITATGPYDNQPQPHTGWAIQIWVDDGWQDLAKAENGWEADTLRGVGGWVSNGLLQWRGLEPVVTTKVRFTAYANPDSLADGVETFADSLWSFVFVGRTDNVKSTLIQYLDFSGTEADNEMDDMVNLGLLHEAVVSASFKAGEIENSRGQPSDMLFDPVKGNFFNTQTPWGEFGYPWQYDAGFPEESDPFYWQVEWPVPKKINYFTWGGVYGNQPQPNTPWAVQYWENDAWVTVMDGVGGSLEDGMMGVDVDAQSIWQSETPIETRKFRLAVWSDGIDPLFSFHIRGRGGSTLNWDETDSTFKAILLQYRNLETAVESKPAVMPTEFSLGQNYPNPFNPQTNIGFSLPQRSHVKLVVYNIQGQQVAILLDAIKPSGRHQITFDASSMNSGVYFYKLETDQGILVKKMMLMK